jgi:hypothetical protein
MNSHVFAFDLYELCSYQEDEAFSNKENMKFHLMHFGNGDESTSSKCVKGGNFVHDNFLASKAFGP